MWNSKVKPFSERSTESFVIFEKREDEVTGLWWWWWRWCIHDPICFFVPNDSNQRLFEQISLQSHALLLDMIANKDRQSCSCCWASDKVYSFFQHFDDFTIPSFIFFDIFFWIEKRFFFQVAGLQNSTLPFIRRSGISKYGLAMGT